MAQFKILGRFDTNTLPRILPPYLGERVAATTRPSPLYTVILFPHNRESGGVATSSSVRKALGKVPADEPLLVAGDDFTVEATALLNERQAVIVRSGEFGWTDDSYRTRHERSR